LLSSRQRQCCAVQRSKSSLGGVISNGGVSAALLEVRRAWPGNTADDASSSVSSTAHLYLKLHVAWMRVLDRLMFETSEICRQQAGKHVVGGSCELTHVASCSCQITRACLDINSKVLVQVSASTQYSPVSIGGGWHLAHLSPKL